MLSTSVTVLDAPGCTVAALLIAALCRKAYGDGPGTPTCRGKLLALIVAGFIVAVIWRTAAWSNGAPFSAIDLTGAILCGMLLFNAAKAAIADGPLEARPKGRENTPLIVMLFTVPLILAMLAFSFGCVGDVLMVCKPNGDRFFSWSYVEPLPQQGAHVDELPSSFQ